MTTCSCPTSDQGDLDQHQEALAKIFKSLGHPVRLKIIRNLIEGERCVCAIHEGTGRDLSTISSHLSILKESGVIKSEQRGKNIYYSLCCPCIGHVCQCLCEHLTSKN